MPIIVPQYSVSPNFSSTAALNAQVGLTGSWSALTSFTIAGLSVSQISQNFLYYVQRYVGETNVPADIRRLRRSVYEVMARMGQPVIVKHMFNDHDARIGIAQPSPISGTYASTYGHQVRNRDPFSYGTGYCSLQLSNNEWIDPNTGAITTASNAPGPGFVQAPFYRGYGPGYLTYLIEPDAPLDIFKLSSSGAIIKTQSQTVVAPWFPEINDNDLIINVELKDGLVVDAHDRYQAKKTAPISIRGLDRKGKREYSADHGNRHVVNQNLEMSAIPETSVLYQVEIDR